MPFHHVGVYDAFHSFAEAKEHYRRCRSLKCFKLDKAAVKALDPVCSYCGKKFSEHSHTANEWASPESGLRFEHTEEDMLANHCWYNPRTKQIASMQYVCSWNAALDKIFKLSDTLY